MFVRRLRNVIAGVATASVIALSLAAPAVAEEGRAVKSKVSPVYPELARRMNVAGTVKVQVVVAPNGTVKTAKVVGGHPLLVDPALDAVKKWKYEPASEETTSIVEFRFEPNNN